MAKQQMITKRVAISKASAQIVAVVGIAAFVTVFCLVASKAVFSQNQYQARVTSAKEKAHKQLQDNLKAFDSLSAHYTAFNNASTNIIGGLNGGSGDNDGSNTKIILDALPSSYDFPGLTSSLEKIFADNSLKVSDITGTDDQVNQQGNLSSPNPQPIPIPFSFTISNAGYQSVQQLMNKLQSSIRPIQVDTIDVSGGNSDMTIKVDAHTFYQPALNLNISKKVIK